jgi:hypothetical protein
MADTPVILTHVTSDAYDQYPPWATEDTTVKIQEILKKMYGLHASSFNSILKKLSASGGAASDPASMKSFNDALDKADKGLKKENESIPKKQKERKEVEDHHKKQLFNWKSVTSSITGFNFALLTLEGIAIAIGETLKENFNTYTKLNEAGINMISGFNGVTDGFKGVQELAVLTGVRFTDLAETMMKYGTAVNSFSAGKFAKAVGKASTDLGQFGFTAKEGAELIGGMLDAQRNYTDLGLKSEQQVSDEAVKLGKNIFRLSMATGMARSEILKNMDALAASTEANVYAGQVGEQTATDMTAFLGSFKNQKIGQQILKMLSDPIKPLNETFMNLQKVGMGGFATSFTNFTKSLEGMPDEMKQQALKSYIEAHKGELQANQQRLAMLAQAGVEGAQASLDFTTGLIQQANSIKRLTKEEIDNQEKTNKARTAFGKQWDLLMSKMQSIFAPTIPLINMLTTGLTYLNEGVDWAVGVFKSMGDDLMPVWDGIKDFATYFQSLDFSGTGEFFKAMGGALKFLWKDILVPLIGAAVDWVKIIFLGIKGTIDLINDVGKWIGESIAKIVLAFDDAGKLWTDAWNDMIGSFKSAWDFVVNTIKSAADAILHPFKAIGDALGIGGGDSKPTSVQQHDALLRQAGVTEITVPKDPKPSTIDSPSATVKGGGDTYTPVADQSEGKKRALQEMGGKGLQSGGSETDVHLAHHGDLLTSIADGISSLVSTNKDILKYTKVS